MSHGTASTPRATAPAIAIAALALAALPFTSALWPGEPPATTAVHAQEPARGQEPAAADSAPQADVDRLTAALQVHEGSIVGEVGAGGGKMTLAMSRLVGASGRVYSTELGDDRLASLRRAVEAAGAQNVTIVGADPMRTNLPEACCDALFMQNVYHHFEDPAAMNASLLRSLKPGGRLAVEDFAPRGGEAGRPEDRDDEAHHGVGAETVQRELEQAGFEAVGVEKPEGRDRGFLVIVRKPASAPAGGN